MWTWHYQMVLTGVLSQGFSEVAAGAAALRARLELENLPKLSPVEVGVPLFLAGCWLEASFACVILHGVGHHLGPCIS